MAGASTANVRSADNGVTNEDVVEMAKRAGKVAVISVRRQCMERPWIWFRKQRAQCDGATRADYKTTRSLSRQ